MKSDRLERQRRIWAFGPNLLAALISLVGVLLSIGASIAIAYYRLRTPPE
jgi:hypothetical protein